MVVTRSGKSSYAKVLQDGGSGSESNDDLSGVAPEPTGRSSPLPHITESGSVIGSGESTSDENRMIGGLLSLPQDRDPGLAGQGPASNVTLRDELVGLVPARSRSQQEEAASVSSEREIDAARADSPNPAAATHAGTMYPAYAKGTESVNSEDLGMKGEVKSEGGRMPGSFATPSDKGFVKPKSPVRASKRSPSQPEVSGPQFFKANILDVDPVDKTEIAGRWCDLDENGIGELPVEWVERASERWSPIRNEIISDLNLEAGKRRDRSTPRKKAKKSTQHKKDSSFVSSKVFASRNDLNNLHVSMGVIEEEPVMKSKGKGKERAVESEEELGDSDKENIPPGYDFEESDLRRAQIKADRVFALRMQKELERYHAERPENQPVGRDDLRQPDIQTGDVERPVHVPINENRGRSQFRTQFVNAEAGPSGHVHSSMNPSSDPSSSSFSSSSGSRGSSPDDSDSTYRGSDRDSSSSEFDPSTEGDSTTEDSSDEGSETSSDPKADKRKRQKKRKDELKSRKKHKRKSGHHGRSKSSSKRAKRDKAAKLGKTVSASAQIPRNTGLGRTLGTKDKKRNNRDKKKRSKRRKSKHLDSSSSDSGSESEFMDLFPSEPESVYSSDSTDTKTRKRAAKRKYKRKLAIAKRASEYYKVAPKEYDGSPNMYEFEKWSRDIKRWIKGSGMKMKHILPLIGQYMKGRAYKWYEREVVNGRRTFTKTEFFSALFDHVFPPDFRTEQRDKFENTHQGNWEIRDFIQRLQDIASTIGDVSEREIVRQAWRRSQVYVRTYLTKRGFDVERISLEQFSKYAQRAERTEKLLAKENKGERSQRTRPSTDRRNEGRNGGRNNDSGRKDKPTPQGQASSTSGKRPNNFQNKTRNQNDREHRPKFQPKPKLDKETRQRYMKENRCFKCSKEGHNAKDCPDSKVTNAVLNLDEDAIEKAAKERAAERRSKVKAAEDMGVASTSLAGVVNLDESEEIRSLKKRLWKDSVHQRLRGVIPLPFDDMREGTRPCAWNDPERFVVQELDDDIVPTGLIHVQDRHCNVIFDVPGFLFRKQTFDLAHWLHEKMRPHLDDIWDAREHSQPVPVKVADEDPDYDRNYLVQADNGWTYDARGHHVMRFRHYTGELLEFDCENAEQEALGKWYESSNCGGPCCNRTGGIKHDLLRCTEDVINYVPPAMVEWYTGEKHPDLEEIRHLYAVYLRRQQGLPIQEGEDSGLPPGELPHNPDSAFDADAEEYLQYVIAHGTQHYKGPFKRSIPRSPTPIPCRGLSGGCSGCEDLGSVSDDGGVGNVPDLESVPDSELDEVERMLSVVDTEDDAEDMNVTIAEDDVEHHPGRTESDLSELRGLRDFWRLVQAWTLSSEDGLSESSGEDGYYTCESPWEDDEPVVFYVGAVTAEKPKAKKGKSVRNKADLNSLEHTSLRVKDPSRKVPRPIIVNVRVNAEDQDHCTRQAIAGADGSVGIEG
ncbi:uncharacterized protein STEHIDRAFT_109583 [Stereum hirsutum FP-91666 SS1]|uniref:uncharacterized protein n=1 Tax=Stereum hirsutum (strain FP-91666) TaxID=721885 RepID=UPI000440A3C8|nr:uncharacterized protein STEHIDRAFT_109583 [Stereum hirsutum FP-91666 SS1]EIM89392.1 hypothetical protein STEHIDRAFT_109583 [Stereum hirsutum FP-91666 SS1]